MTKNPLINAFAASGYIVLVVSIMNYLSARLKDTPDKVLAPIAALSLFTLSAAVMGYIFGSQPLQLYFEGKKKEAVDLFLKTVGVFAVITALILTTVASGFLS